VRRFGTRFLAHLPVNGDLRPRLRPAAQTSSSVTLVHAVPEFRSRRHKERLESLLTIMASCASNEPQRRRGTRVCVQIPVRITSLDPATIFAENCHTLTVNPQGCGIRCSRPLEMGLQLRIDELPGRGTALARVACTRALSDGGRYWIVGIALDSPGNLWCIAPAPADWGSYSSPAKFSSAAVRYVAEHALPDSRVSKTPSSKR
jgi:hypothetical protein